MKKGGKSFVLVLLLASLISGCSKKPEGQVVAVVNGEEISKNDINNAIQALQIPQGTDTKKTTQDVVQRLVNRTLLVEKAKSDGLDKSVDYLNQLQKDKDDLLIALLSRQVSKAIPVPSSAAVDAYIAANPTLFNARKRYTFDQVAFSTPSNADVLKNLQPTHSLAAVEAVLTAAGIPFRRGSAVVDSGSLNPALARTIDALPPGEPFIIPSRSGFIANVIKSSEPIPTDPEQARSTAVGILQRQALEEAIKKDLDTIRKSARIEYQPGFGPTAATSPTAGASSSAATNTD